mgnify:CR=1 FL=1
MTLSALRTLVLSFCKISDEFVLDIAKFPQLRTLKLNGCDAVTETSVARLGASLPSLSALSVGSSSLGSAWLSSLSNHPSLVRLEVWDSKKVQPAAIASFMEAAPFVLDSSMNVRPPLLCSLLKQPGFSQTTPGTYILLRSNRKAIGSVVVVTPLTRPTFVSREERGDAKAST